MRSYCFHFQHARLYCKMQFIFSCLPCSLLCFYYTGFSKKSLSDYCVKSVYISEIFRDFFVSITDYCYFILNSCKSPRYFSQSFQRNIPLLLQKASKKSIFNKYIYKMSPYIFCFPSPFFLCHHKNPIVLFACHACYSCIAYILF